MLLVQYQNCVFVNVIVCIIPKICLSTVGCVPLRVGSHSLLPLSIAYSAQYGMGYQGVMSRQDSGCIKSVQLFVCLKVIWTTFQPQPACENDMRVPMPNVGLCNM